MKEAFNVFKLDFAVQEHETKTRNNKCLQVDCACSEIFSLYGRKVLRNCLLNHENASFALIVRKLYLYVLTCYFLFLVNHIEDRPWWPI